MNVQGRIDFSFIIPSYNRARLLARTLNSILYTDLLQIEIILIDDGSTDDTREVVTSMNDERIIYTRIANSERGAARNFGLKLSRGTYVVYFDSDDLLLPKLESLKDFIKEYNNPAVVFAPILNDGKTSTSNLPYREFRDNLLFNNFLACGSVFIKREVATEFPFNEDRRLSSAEDWELWLRLYCKHSFTFFAEPIFEQVQHSGRSLNTISPEQIESRDTLFADLVRSNVRLKDFYGANAINLFVADRYTFVALAWVNNDRRKAFRFLRAAISQSRSVVKRRRFWAVIKKLLVG